MSVSGTQWSINMKRYYSKWLLAVGLSAYTAHYSKVNVKVKVKFTLEQGVEGPEVE